MSFHRTLIRLSALLAVVALAKGCGDGESPSAPPPPEPARPTTVTVSPATHELTALGTTVQLSAEVRDQNARVMAGATVTWTSSASSMATVDASGLVTAAGNGTATITASAGSASGSAVVTVMQSVASVEVSPSVYELTALGQTVQLTAEAFDENGHAVAGAEFSWESSDAAVATVDAGGLVTAVAEGVATITASAGEASGSAVVPVMQPVASVQVSPSAETIGLGSTLQLTAEAFDENGHAVAGAEFSWESSDAAVATVDAGGLVTGVAVGTATITASVGGAQGTAEITVGPNPDRAALEALYHATDGPNWVNNENWLTNAPLGEWYGVDTDASGRVVGLNLSGDWDSEARKDVTHGLSGPIPRELGDLTSLRQLILHNNDLRGPIPTELGNLANLEILGLAYNDLRGRIPPELGNLASLEFLSLSDNSLTGTIPRELGNLSELRLLLQLHDNQLTGPIPPELGNLASLEFLSLSDNSLTGTIPTELGNLANLVRLQLSSNKLTGTIPAELGNLANLKHMGLGGNALTGPIPPQLGQLSNLEFLVLNVNALTGAVPPELGDLSSLRGLGLARNQLSGPIPRNLLKLRLEEGFGAEGNAGLCAPGTTEFIAWLRAIPYPSLPLCNEADIAALEALYQATGGTGWTNSDGWVGDGSVSGWYGVSADSLGRVLELGLSRNGLSGRIPGLLGNLDAMTGLKIDGNALSGRLPITMLGLPLQEFRYTGTRLCTPPHESFRRWLNAIPSHDGTGIECAPPTDRNILVALYDATNGSQWRNNATWLTDAPLGDWHGVRTHQGRVVQLDLRYNGMEGSIPLELGSLSQLEDLWLSNNHLTGQIPTELGNLSNLLTLDLGYNRLTSSIPTELGNLSHLSHLNLSANDLTGRIPSEFGSLTDLQRLHLSGNDLGGQIPTELGNLSSLELLDLAANDLTGRIPSEFGSLTDLQRLHLSGNDLGGQIPTELGNLSSLELLDLAANDLSGLVPTELGNLGRLKRLVLANNDLAGSVPDEFGSLTNLEQLVLTANPSMSGSLPTTLTKLAFLDFLVAGGTSLCAPSDAMFRAWLGAMRTSRVPFCGGKAETAAYLVQAVQSLDFPVPLVEGRPALLRVFVTAPDAGGEGIPAVRATFYLGGQELHVVDLPSQSIPIPTMLDEGVLAESANALIPASVIRRGLEMVIEIDPEGQLATDLGVTRRIPATGLLAVDVHTMPAFDLTVVPFLWVSDPDSSVLARTAGLTADNTEFGHTRTLLPVGQMNVKTHEPVLTSSNDSHSLLAETEALRVMEGASGHYLGTMSDDTRPPGVAILSGKSSFSVFYEPTLAHELGHNLSLRHAPCGGAGGPDPAFPTGDGSTGAWGYDFALVPPQTPDLMSYCLPKWISDYHFTKALRFRLGHMENASVSTAAAARRSLLVWGGVNADAVPYLEPAFVVEASAVLPDSAGDHRLTGRASSGGELFSLSFTMPEMADGNGSSSFAFVLPAWPASEENLASITLAGPGGSFTLDGESDLSMAILRNPRNGQVRGILRHVPPPAQAARDAVGQAAGPRLEVLFSRGIPDGTEWRR